MAKIEFPPQLANLLEGSTYFAPIQILADRISSILSDNKLPFFPDYTDHGIDHVNSILRSTVDLIPPSIWPQTAIESVPRLLCDADAAVIIGSVLLHDIAMHLRETGFLELISEGSRFKPLAWFKDPQVNHPTDRPWSTLWADFVQEARRFNDRDLANIIGEESAKGWKFEGLPANYGKWERNHYLIIGEFIRRHHARLAHEIAIYGFPGVPAGSGDSRFPALGKEEGHAIMMLADLIGLTARSHGTSLRLCKAYLDSSVLYPGTPRPMGVAVLYSMALLRVADYLQIDRQRTPAVLLQLRNPPSPISIMEWKKHLAVQRIDPATDPRGKFIAVNNNLSWSVYLQLRDLIAALQEEIDHSTAVLDEVYGNLQNIGLDKLNLAIRRVHSNLHSPAFRDSLPYIPEHTGFTADSNLLTLLVEPLYGQHPGVGVRELMQNALDAVCELHAWNEIHAKSNSSSPLDNEEDILIEYIKKSDSSWTLKIKDKGIGMTGETINNYFLRAGASFRRSAEWTKAFVKEDGSPVVARSGRFGVGAFAIFLLGPSFRMYTRHISSAPNSGHMILATDSSQVIKIHRVEGLEIGTTIEVDLSPESVDILGLDYESHSRFSAPEEQVDWFCWNWPTLKQYIVRDSETRLMSQQYKTPLRNCSLPPEWSKIHPLGFDAVYWTFMKNCPALTCNGIRIAEPELMHDAGFSWDSQVLGVLRPNIAVIDSKANLPLTTQRYALSQPNLPFHSELSRDVMLSVIAHALVRGPSNINEAFIGEQGHPLRIDQDSTYELNGSFMTRDSEKEPFATGRLRWCCTESHFIPSDPWLYKLLETKTCLMFGHLSFNGYYDYTKSINISSIIENDVLKDCGFLKWCGSMRTHGSSIDEIIGKLAVMPATILDILVNEGVSSLGHKLKASRVIVSTINEMDFTNPTTSFEKKPSTQSWSKIKNWDAKRSHFIKEKGQPNRTINLQKILDETENRIDLLAPSINKRIIREQIKPDVLFIAQLEVEAKSNQPESMLAQVWNEFLDANAIPFDSKARKQLILKCSSNPELKRHIKIWDRNQH